MLPKAVDSWRKRREMRLLFGISGQYIRTFVDFNVTEEAEVEQIRSELNERSQLEEEEVAIPREHLNVKNKVIESEKRLRNKCVELSLVSILALRANDITGKDWADRGNPRCQAR
jgi:hypothetical protein